MRACGGVSAIDRAGAFFNRLRRDLTGLDDVALLARVVLLDLTLSAALAFVSPAKIVVRLDRGRRSNRPVSIPKAVGFADSVIRRRHLASGRCLRRALILFRLLRTSGWPVSIRFGLDRNLALARRLEGHSWICVDGRPVAEGVDPAERYDVIYGYAAGIGPE